MTVAVKEAMKWQMQWQYNNIPTLQHQHNRGKSKTTTFQCISRPFESLISLQNIYLNFYTEKTAGGKVTLNWHNKRNSSIHQSKTVSTLNKQKKDLINIMLLAVKPSSSFVIWQLSHRRWQFVLMQLHSFMCSKQGF